MDDDSDSRHNTAPTIIKSPFHAPINPSVSPSPDIAIAIVPSVSASAHHARTRRPTDRSTAPRFLTTPTEPISNNPPTTLIAPP